jgi:hypothetical protein
MVEAPILHYNQMTPTEAAFLHPGHWDGQSVGVGNVRRLPVAKLRLSRTLVLSFTDWAKEMAINKAKGGGYLPGQVLSFGPGAEFTAADHANKVVVFDQSVMLSRGDLYRVSPDEFPPQPPFAIPGSVNDPRKIYTEEPRMRYLREQAQVARMGSGANAENILQTTLERHVGFQEYGRQVGALVMPETVQVGAVSHYVVDGGHDMLMRTHNIYVFPQPGAQQ